LRTRRSFLTANGRKISPDRSHFSERSDRRLFEEDDYREILKDRIAKAGPLKRGFNTRLADHLNINPSLVSQILTGHKDFTEEQIVLVCEFLEFLEFSNLESRYVLTLVQISRAGSVKLKNDYRTALEELRTKAMDLSSRIEFKNSSPATIEPSFTPAGSTRRST
jgi:hypothetical protein